MVPLVLGLDNVVLLELFKILKKNSNQFYIHTTILNKGRYNIIFEFITKGTLLFLAVFLYT